ncbi:uracil-DNA glycosylase, partial [Pelagibacterales bacterium SAG-MED09]|nr:uracil-DNA glycosylase [Pelagibacterales bacterium SAG-MED09]
MDIKLNNLNKTIINCKKCPRLVKFIKRISTKKRKQNINENYWGKPVPGFGDSDSKLAIVGLAPAAHGGTRTGRAFTGDKSGDFLFKCLYKVGISSSPLSKNLNDNLKLKSTYITNILKCVPPEDKPLSKEISNCSKFFDEEILSLKELRVIVTLGKVAFDNCVKLYKQKFNIKKKIFFKHGKTQLMPNGLIILASYH